MKHHMNRMPGNHKDSEEMKRRPIPVIWQLPARLEIESKAWIEYEQ